MHALSYLDRLHQLDELVDELVRAPEDDNTLVARAFAWISRVDTSLSFAAPFCRNIAELAETIGNRGPAPARRYARAGLAYLERSGGPEPENLTQLALQAHAFVLSLLVHQARAAADGKKPWTPPALSAEARGKADAIFRGMLSQDGRGDTDLIRKVRAWCADPGVPVTSSFIRQLLRNAEFLASVLEVTDSHTPDHLSTARAALGYLVKEDDAIRDRLGPAGYRDDAHILDTAVALIEPARESWVRLIEAARSATHVLGQASTKGPDGVSVPLSFDTVSGAALLSEPLGEAHGVLDTALFLPTSGIASVAVALAAVVDLLHEHARRLDPDSDPSELDLRVLTRLERKGQFVVLVAPTSVAPGWVRAVRVGGVRLDELLPVASLDADGHLRPWPTARKADPLLAIVPTIDAAAHLDEGFRSRVRLTLIDQASASGEEVEEEPSEPDEDSELREEPTLSITDYARRDPMGTRRRRGRKRGDGEVDLTGVYMDDVGSHEQLSVQAEADLSLRMIDARTRMAEALLRLGPTVVPNLGGEGEEGGLAWVPRLMEAARADEPGARERWIERCLEGLDDDRYMHMVASVHGFYERCRALRRAGAPGREAYEAELGVSVDEFFEAFRVIKRAMAELADIVDQLVKANLRLVLWMARKYRDRPFHLDMVQEGNLGLMRAARKFDHRKGARFGSYASWWIRQTIEVYLSRHTRTIRIPSNTLNKVRRLRKASVELESVLGRKPTEKDLAEHLELDVRRVRRYQRVGHDIERGCVALDGPVDEESGTTLGDLIPDPEEALPSETLSTAQLVREALKLLDTLTEREAKVLRLRYGLGDAQPHSLSQLGELLGVSRERVRHIELRAMAKLRFRAKHLGVRP